MTDNICFVRGRNLNSLCYFNIVLFGSIGYSKVVLNISWGRGVPGHHHLLPKCDECFQCFFSIAVTKLDILDSFENVKIGVGYKVDGKRLPLFPGIIITIWFKRFRSYIFAWCKPWVLSSPRRFELRSKLRLLVSLSSSPPICLFKWFLTGGRTPPEARQ